MNKEGEATIGVVTFRAEQVLPVRHGNKKPVIFKIQLVFLQGELNLMTTGSQKRVRRRLQLGELREETGYEVDEVNLAEFEGNHSWQVIRSDGSIVKMSWNVFLASQITGEMKEGMTRRRLSGIQ